LSSTDGAAMQPTHVTRYSIFRIEQKIQALSSETLIQISEKSWYHIPERSNIDESSWNFESKRPFLRPKYGSEENISP